MWGVNPGSQSESVCPIQPPQPPLGCDFSKLSPPLCLFLEFTMLKWWLEWGWESWSHFHNHNFSRQKCLGKRSAPDFDGRITFSWSLLPVNLLTFFPRRPAFSVECHFKPSPFFFFFFFERERDWTSWKTASRLPRIQSWSSRQRSGEQSALVASTPKLISLSVNACHGVFRSHFGNF